MTVCYLSQKGGLVCEYMHARAIYNVLAQGPTVQKGGSNPNPLRQITPCIMIIIIVMLICRDNGYIITITITSELYCSLAESIHELFESKERNPQADLLRSQQHGHHFTLMEIGRVRYWSAYYNYDLIS